MSLPSAILTGFRPFPAVSVNPSALLVEAVSRDPGFARAAGVRLETRLLDTVYGGLRDRIARLLDRAPDALVLTGYSTLARGFKLETAATSLCSPDFADASGWCPPRPRDPVSSTANRAVDFPGLLDALRAAEVPAGLSEDAGAYVCNHAYWHALDLVARRGLATRVLFLHVPAIEGMDNAPAGAAAMDFATMRRGLAVVLRALSA